MNMKLGMIACAGLIATVGLTFGCGDSSSTGGAGGTGTSTTGAGTTGSNTTATSTHASTGASPATTTTGSGTVTATSTGTGSADDCATYCTIITANCTANDKQFESAAACNTACTAAALPAGTVMDTTHHTLGCHIYHANAALTGPDVHCWHAGLPGYADSAKAAPGPCEN